MPAGVDLIVMRQEMVSAAKVAATAAKVSAAVAAQPLHVSPPFLCPIRLLLAPLPLLPSPPSDSVRPPHDIELASELCCLGISTHTAHVKDTCILYLSCITPGIMGGG